MGNSIAEVSKETLQLEAYFKEKEPGEFVPYKEIEQETGVLMDYRGKGFIKTALNRLDKEYTTRKGQGIELASAENGMSIVINRLVRINNAVKRGDKTTRNIQNEFLMQMSDQDKKRVLFCASVFGAIRLAAEQGRVMFAKKKEPVQLPPIKLPEL